MAYKIYKEGDKVKLSSVMQETRTKASNILKTNTECKINMSKKEWINQAYYFHLYCKKKKKMLALVRPRA